MLNVLRDELSTLYPDADSVRRIVADTNLPSVFINFDAPIIDVWHQVIEQARIRGQLTELVRVAMTEYPGRPILQQFYGALIRGSQPSGNSKVIEEKVMPEIDPVLARLIDIGERMARVETWMLSLTGAIVVLALLYLFK